MTDFQEAKLIQDLEHLYIKLSKLDTLVSFENYEKIEILKDCIMYQLNGLVQCDE